MSNEVKVGYNRADNSSDEKTSKETFEKLLTKWDDIFQRDDFFGKQTIFEKTDKFVEIGAVRHKCHFCCTNKEKEARLLFFWQPRDCKWSEEWFFFYETKDRKTLEFHYTEITDSSASIKVFFNQTVENIMNYFGSSAHVDIPRQISIGGNLSEGISMKRFFNEIGHKEVFEHCEQFKEHLYKEAQCRENEKKNAEQAKVDLERKAELAKMDDVLGDM